MLDRPIRDVVYNEKFQSSIERQGGPKKEFLTGKALEERREYLANNLIDIENYINEEPVEFRELNHIIETKLDEKAIAKSHRPETLLSSKRGKIVGVDEQNTLLLSVNKTSIKNLKEEIKNTKNKAEKINIGTITNFKLSNPNNKLKIDLDKLKTITRKDGNTYLKVTIFDHKNSEINRVLRKNLEQFVEEEFGLKIETVLKFENFELLKLKGADKEQILKIATHPAIHRLSAFPKYKILNTEDKDVKELLRDLPKPEYGKKYPIIGILDSGIDTSSEVNNWVIDRESAIPNETTDTEHGTAVGSLASFGYTLINSNTLYADKDTINLIDVRVIGDEEKDGLSEDILSQRLNEFIPKLRDKYPVKIWNMSIASEESCEDYMFSDLGVILDDIQEENNILMVLPTGNVDGNLHELRPWGNRRLQIPADSVRAITVGAIALKENSNSEVHINEPPVYCCVGPGPSWTVKPDLVHYSGNTSTTNDRGLGIPILNKNNKLAEEWGTSFSAPLVARTLSILEYKLPENASLTRIKALAIHNATLPRVSKHLSKLKKQDYFGFGKPNPVSTMLDCDKSEITLVFEEEIKPKHKFEYNLPWPKSLTNNKTLCNGEVFITLVSNPPLDKEFGAEYIRGQVNLNLKAHILNKKTNEREYKSIISEDVTTNSITSTLDKSNLYEKELVKNSYKWKPIKKYHKKVKGIDSDEWILTITNQFRATMTGKKSIKFVVILTIRDPAGKQNVYDEIINELTAKGIITNPIELRAETTQRIRI